MNTNIINFTNLDSATQQDNVFIVENEADGYAFQSVGAKALCIETYADSVNQLLNHIANNVTIKCQIVFAFNSAKTSILISNILADDYKYYSNLRYYFANIKELYLGLSSASEACSQNRDAFLNQIRNITPEKIYDDTESSYRDLLDFMKDDSDTILYPTHYPLLDKALDDGLTEGFYVLGGQSSLGKTTLMQQIADQMGDNGTDVLFFSLEMSKKELMAKSLSRLTYQNCNGNEANAKTTKGMMVKSRYTNYSPTELQLISDSTKIYAQSGRSHHIYYKHLSTPIDIAYIRKEIQHHYDMKGKYPIICVDYLQIMAQVNERFSDKMNTDKNVFALKAISNDYHIPVIVTSSLNRDNYYGDISMKAFKESGAIEYSADVLLGLQFYNFSNKKHEEELSDEKLNNKLKAEKIRELEVVVLKNRNGEVGTKIPFKFYAMFNTFTEAPELLLEEEQTKVCQQKVSKKIPF